MTYLELGFELGHLDPEAAEAACFATGALSITLSDAADDPVLEPAPQEVRLWRRTRLQALYDAEHADIGLISRLATALEIEPASLTARAVADRVWEREWLRDFHALRFGQRLWVCPRHEHVTDPGAVVLKLDPGLAFGTGTHPSTALCLQWLEGQLLTNCDVIDYGCGSGILGIAALLLGARHSYAFDIDPQALIATRDNAADNGVLECLQVCKHVQELPQRCDVLLANILAPVLISLAPQLAQRLRPGGSLLLAGILTDQQSQVASAFAPWFDMMTFAQRDNWVAITGIRRK